MSDEKSQKRMSGKKTLPETAEFIARCDATQQLIMGSMPPSCGCGGEKDHVTFRATLFSYAMDASYPIEISVPRELSDGLKIEKRTSDDAERWEYVIVCSDGTEGPARMRFSQCHDASGKYLVQAGQFDDGDDNVVDFLYYTDPLPPAVAFGVGAAVLCGALALIDKWTSDCSEELKTTIDACKARGGIPVFHGFVTVAFNPFEGSVGCSFQCVWDRCDVPGSGSGTGPSTTTTTTVTKPDGTTTTTTETRPVGATGPALTEEQPSASAIFNCGDTVLGVGTGTGNTASQAHANAHDLANAMARRQCPQRCPPQLQRVVFEVPHPRSGQNSPHQVTIAARYTCAG